MVILFGPSGLGSVKSAVSRLEELNKKGLKACEIAFTYSIYIKDKQKAEEIGETAKKLGIKLSIHAPYWINLNSDDEEKIEKSKQRILKCCEVGTWLKAKRVIFHSGYYGKNKESAYENIKNAIIDIQKRAKQNNYTPKLAPEIMGRKNVFGSIDEIFKLKQETGCDICVDFAHILARYGTYKFEHVLNKLKDIDEIHIHFSGIEYGDKGEKKHIKTHKKEWTKLLKALKENIKRKEIIIINEAPTPTQDALEGLEIYKKLK